MLNKKNTINPVAGTGNKTGPDTGSGSGQGENAKGTPGTPGMAGSQAGTAEQALAALDNSELSRFHLKAMLTSGMGFFTDAYDLFIIGVVLAILTPIWHLSPIEISVPGSSSLLADACSTA